MKARLWSRFALTLLSVLAASLYTSRDARGNGRFPRAQMIVSAPGGSGQTLWMRTTFGILRSGDAGKSFRWICEKALGFNGVWDPPLAVLRDGRLIVGLDDGVLSTMDGCSFSRDPGLVGETVKDLTTDATGTIAYAITGARGKPGRVWKRSATGVWQKLGADYDNTNFLTIDVAPSNPARIYLTGESWNTVRGEVWSSSDGGASFKEQKNELPASGPFFLSYVDPKNPERIILRHLHPQGSDVLVSADGGKTMHQVVHWLTSMFGFAKSEDGQTVWIGSGDPKDGIWRSVDRGEHFEPVSSEGVYCLFAHGDLLYTCANPYSLGGYALGISRDQGKTLDKVSGFADVEGAMLCDAGPSLCEPVWPETRAAILPSEAPADGGAEASPVSDAGSLDAGSPRPQPTTRTTCGCDVVGASSSAPWSILCLVGLIPLGVWARDRTRLDRSRSEKKRNASIGDNYRHD